MRKIVSLIICIYLYVNCFAQSIVADKKSATTFTLVDASTISAIYVDENDDVLVQKSAALLQQDIFNVTGKKPDIIHRVITPKKSIIIIGTIQKSSLIKELIQAKKINPTTIQNKWEAYQINSIKNAFEVIENALVITGNDRRGTAYGIFELSKQLGVSPWYWWADVPVKKKENIYINATVSIIDSPIVKYRGIFINDEAPSLSNWSKEKFGGFNHQFYEKVFELLLRLKANYLWPAMWGNAFNDDDKLNKVLADEYGIVMGTSHHEPMLRSQQEWKRYGQGEWNYEHNDTTLNSFWRKGIENMGNHESIVTIGMRGDGDEPMTEGTATALLEKIVKKQREIITEVTGKPANQTPQLWALYKEVQDYYDKGMRVPDDVTLLLCDDNWGNLRKLPNPDRYRENEKPRAGGYGIYYHFDYVGGPRNYKWVNTNNIARIWEQMHLAYEFKADKIWIVNVGDIKPMELPTSFFLDYSWNPKKWNADNINTYHETFAAQQFGATYAKEIGVLLNKYTLFNARRKPELLDAKTYSLYNYNEAIRVTDSYNNLLVEAEKINTQLPVEYKDAFFQLVLHPIKACANLNELYLTVAQNKEAYSNKNAMANVYADKAKQLFINDSLITLQYHQLANGKWSHMMSQTHIGYTYWQQPLQQVMPEVKYVLANEIVGESPLYDTTVQSAQYNIPKGIKGNIFYEFHKWASMQASHYTRAISGNNIKWQTIKNIGRDGDGITPFPVTSLQQKISATSPHLEYEVYTYSKGEVKLNLYFSPTLNFHNTVTGLQYAISIDDEQPQIISLNKDSNNEKQWEQWVSNNIIIKTSQHKLLKPGKHTIKFWMVDAGIILQKIVLDCGGLKPSYLGPQETNIKKQ